MESYSVFPGRKNQHCEDYYTTKCNLQIPIKLPMAFFTEPEQKISQCISQCFWKHKRPQITTALLRKKMELEDSTFLTSDYATKLQFQDSMVLAQKYKYRPMEQNRKLRDKPMNLWVP